MKIIDFSKQNSIINKYMAEMRDKDYQSNRLLFRNNIMRVGELIAYELSKTLDYETRDVQTPLGTAKVNVPTDKLVLGTIFRAGLPFHQGFLNIFDHAGNAFVSAYREYEDKDHTKVGIHVEYLATPDLNDATLLIVDPMLATGGSMEMGYKALLTKGKPKKVHVVCVMAAPEGIEHIRKTFPEDTTIWCAAIDGGTQRTQVYRAGIRRRRRPLLRRKDLTQPAPAEGLPQNPRNPQKLGCVYSPTDFTDLHR